MSRIKPVAEDTATVTLSRTDFEALLLAAENSQDAAVFNAQRAREAALGKDAARADYLAVELVERLLEGESPIRVWREHRGLTQRALAKAAGISTAYLSEIESGTKPGSVAALRKVAGVLGVEMEELCGS